MQNSGQLQLGKLFKFNPQWPATQM